MFFANAGDEADSLAPGKSLGWGTDALVVSANRNRVIRVTVYLASNENDQISDRGWVDGCVKCIGLIVCPHFAHLSQISPRALGRASFEIFEGVRSLFVRNGVAPYNERVGQDCECAVPLLHARLGGKQGARRSEVDSMVDIETATNEEIADQAVQILRLVREEKELKESTLRELIEWLVCYVLRLNNDLQGVPHKTEQEVEKLENGHPG